MNTIRCALLCLTLLITVACDDTGRTFRLPTMPTTGAPTSSPMPPPPTPQPPAPRPPLPVESDFTRIEVGQTINRVIGDAPPECLLERGWPCQYFRLTSLQSGALTITLLYASATQGGQGVDVTLETRGAIVWAQQWSPTRVVLTAPVRSGEEYEIVLWYTFPKLEYVLTTTLAP